MFNLFKKINEDEFESKVKRCDLVYNDTAEDFVIESLKTIEELGKKVIDTSRIFYYTEDKWMFYIKCREHGIPTPDTILLSNNVNIARAELKEFGKWPVVIKRVYGTMGEFVEKADNLEQALKVIKKFLKIDCDRLPIVAQEFISPPSYRVTLIDKRIVQAIIKKSKNWKCTGVYGKKFDKFKVDKKLRGIIKKVVKATNINICGVDLLKKDGQWFVLEINSNPSLDFVNNEHEKLVGFVLDFLKRYHKKRNHKH
ncbi:MAG: ATP-grasp domain-containing protein [Nanoarchaeota archaeon]|nr:ATP-grasp domain-containing protein [Nanoarchaeota archaeon]